MVSKKKVAAGIAIGAGVTTLILIQKTGETFELMHKAAENFLQNFPFVQDGLYAEPSLDALFKAQEPYRTQTLIYLGSGIVSGATSICSSIYATKDYISKGLKHLYNIEKRIIDGVSGKRELKPEDFKFW